MHYFTSFVVEKSVKYFAESENVLYEVPFRQSLTRLIERKFQDMYKNMENKTFTLTIDIWTEQNH